MIHGKKLIVIMPAYNAAGTVKRTVDAIPPGYVDEIILVDDCSRDDTARVAEEIGLRVIRHPKNRGYGGNQKTCYTEALRAGADVVVMLHPDYQYSPKLVVAIASMIASEQYDLILASRVLCGSAVGGGMPLYKYVFNRCLTLAQNILMGAKASEFHTGYRGFSRQVLESLALEENSDDFVFDNQMLAQAHFAGFRMGELSCPTRYEPESSSISFKRSVKYGFGVLHTSMLFRLAKWGLVRPRIFARDGRKLQWRTDAVPTSTASPVSECAVAAVAGSADAR